MQHEILTRLDKIEDLITTLLAKERLMSVDLTKLTADVAAQATVVASVQTLISGMAAQIKSLSAASSDPTTQAALDALATQVEASNAALSTAVTANTPAAPAAPAPAAAPAAAEPAPAPAAAPAAPAASS